MPMKELFRLIGVYEGKRPSRPPTKELQVDIKIRRALYPVISVSKVKRTLPPMRASQGTMPHRKLQV